MKLYVYSTLSNDQIYSVKDGDIFIAGKANITNKYMLTPRGMVTSITPEQYAQLKNNHVFVLHMKNNFIHVTEHKEDPEKVATDMQASDKSAPDTKESLEAEGIKAPKENKKKGK